LEDEVYDVTTSIEGVAVKAGAKWSVPPVAIPKIEFSGEIRCKSRTEFMAAVFLKEHELFEVGPFKSHNAALNAIGPALMQRFADLFRS
jgi:hypothetical protein